MLVFFRPHAAIAAHSTSRGSWLCIVSLIYLALPCFLFMAYWAKLPFALLGCTALAIVAFMGAQPLRYNVTSTLGKQRILIAVACGVFWCMFGGAGHFFYANDFDWKVRDAIFRDLTVTDWPLAYGFLKGEPV